MLIEEFGNVIYRLCFVGVGELDVVYCQFNNLIMKSLSPIALVFCLTVFGKSVLAQNVFIPDSAFRLDLQIQYSDCMIGDSLITDCPQVVNETHAYFANFGIADFTGISAFVGAESFDCSRNVLTELNELPPNLYNLQCDENQLTNISWLPETLGMLNCSSNNLTSLPSIPPSLIHLNVSNNLFEVIPPIDSVRYLYLGNNNLTCLPNLNPEMIVLQIHGNNIQCIPNETLGVNAADFGLEVCTSNNIHDCSYLRQVEGNVFFDESNDCALQTNEIGLQNRVVLTDNGTMAISDFNGDYKIFLDTGAYSIINYPINSYWSLDCPLVPYSVVVDGTQDTISGIDFAHSAVESCHWLNVDLSSSNQRPCFATNSYAVSYCNYGTEGAVDVYVDLTFPPEVIPLSSSIPWQQMGGGVYRFEVGDLAIDACGSFNIADSVSCDAVVGSTVCVTAEIFPISPCLIATAQPGWDNSSIEVTGSCNGANIEFLVENVGSGDMTASTDYRIYQDNALLEDGQLAALMSGASIIMSQPADGATYRLEVDQSAGHPGVSLPRATVEGCASPVSLGQVLVSQQNDVDDHIEVSCIELTASYDPNDKRVVPAGYGASHLVHPEDSLLEYTIRFQNTGSDTAFTVEIVDTLPTAYLNPVTFLSGASSHPYTVRMHGNGIVTWRFENILLPDSATNEAGSQGFVKFKIRTRPNLPNGTVINNRANIYFDFNAAIVTETCFITISDVEIMASNSEIDIDDKVEIYPNPTTGLLNLRLSDNRLKATGVSVVDITGREVLRKAFTHQLDISELSAGNYILSVFTDKGVLREKVVVQ